MPEHTRGTARKRLPQRYAPFLMPLVLSVFMSAIVSAVATAASVGVGPDFVVSWPSAWGASWIVAFPSLLLLLPVVRRIVAWMVVQP
ncbi:DUF2798 domain-containing protein [Achromobacter anxifer]